MNRSLEILAKLDEKLDVIHAHGGRGQATCDALVQADGLVDSLYRSEIPDATDRLGWSILGQVVAGTAQRWEEAGDRRTARHIVTASGVRYGSRWGAEQFSSGTARYLD